jgi:signal transduction histidine kinase
MTFSAFIKANIAPIVQEWETFARTLLSPGKVMSGLALRDHCEEILLAVAHDMTLQHSIEERAALSRGDGAIPHGQQDTAAETHGTLRHLAGFDLVQLVSEFRALRASVMALWKRSQEGDLDAAIRTDQVSRFNEALDKALAESVESYGTNVDNSRDMFLAVLGHDLRGPLSGIEMALRLLAKPDLDDLVRRQTLLRIGRASKSMNGLITDLLDYTRTRLGAGIPIEAAPCDLGALCEEVLDAVIAMHPECRFELKMTGDLNIEADAPRIHQVLSNLLGNAVQYGDRVAPILTTVTGNAETVLLAVRNSGEPIPEDAIHTVFEPLVQVPQAVDASFRSKTSLGLGLFIVREIVLGHRGTIRLKSDAEFGTEFRIELPRS